tara:strand:+ start:542 stop:703 length:162 start_codon:yes stop_codon:yes gene_type:complete
MTLVEKIKSVRPNVTDADFIDNIIVQNDSDGRGDYIAQWNHPTETQPTEEELA